MKKMFINLLIIYIVILLLVLILGIFERQIFDSLIMMVPTTIIFLIFVVPLLLGISNSKKLAKKSISFQRNLACGIAFIFWPVLFIILLTFLTKGTTHEDIWIIGVFIIGLLTSIISIPTFFYLMKRDINRRIK